MQPLPMSHCRYLATTHVLGQLLFVGCMPAAIYRIVDALGRNPRFLVNIENQRGKPIGSERVGRGSRASRHKISKNRNRARDMHHALRHYRLPSALQLKSKKHIALSSQWYFGVFPIH